MPPRGIREIDQGSLYPDELLAEIADIFARASKKERSQRKLHEKLGWSREKQDAEIDMQAVERARARTHKWLRQILHMIVTDFWSSEHEKEDWRWAGQTVVKTDRKRARRWHHHFEKAVDRVEAMLAERIASRVIPSAALGEAKSATSVLRRTTSLAVEVLDQSTETRLSKSTKEPKPIKVTLEELALIYCRILSLERHHYDLPHAEKSLFVQFAATAIWPLLSPKPATDETHLRGSLSKEWKQMKREWHGVEGERTERE